MVDGVLSDVQGFPMVVWKLPDELYSVINDLCSGCDHRWFP